MKVIKFLLLLFTLFISNITFALAGDHPEVNFGIYGITHQENLAGYQQYVGQNVKYIPALQGHGNYSDTENFIKAGGSFDKEYTITKISGDDKRMTFILQEKGGKTKVKMIVNNQWEYYSYGKYTYCITENYSIPLILIDKFNSDRVKYKGKVFPEGSESTVKMIVEDLILANEENITDSHKSYPTIKYLLKDAESGKTYDIDIDEDLSIIGTEYTNPAFKCKYNIISIYTEKISNLKFRNYIIKNSLDGNTKKVSAKHASEQAFMGDDAGTFIANLAKVEKPSNPSIRYGSTTTTTEKDITKFSYVDILLYASNTQLCFRLKNVSDNTIKVVWDEAVFVDVDGSTSKIMHSGIKYSEREGSQPASTIIKGAKLEDIAAPIDRIYYDNKLKEWTSYSLYKNAEPKVQNQTIKLMLPIQVKDVINEYTFEFELKHSYAHPEYIAY